MSRAIPATSRAVNTPADHRALLRGLLDRPREVAYLLPSSRFLVEEIVRSAELRHARVVVELGPGTGGTTRALLDAMPETARLLAIELHPRFVRHLHRTLRDPRLVIHRGHAAELGALLRAHGLGAADAIVSGIPFANLSREDGRGILQAVHSNLGWEGRFVAYQLRGRVASLGHEVFGHASMQTVLLNVPPMRVYRWEKG